ncbi:TfuA-like protein [Actinacidiphila bryophytorum]|uniref:TfuA-like protein n=1 Tax=Actinacidiphila bryophytorum TaxID=1436133 RepID=UPI002176E378|nr:TfuA-like protein [Actinacidiphila bryophytorum]UWE12531.1 TfuA-like protein [Actinacidiphila bryophytorum]
MSAVVFIGPSIGRAEAAAELDAEFLPPVKRGDIAELLARPEPPDAIGIVDGKFLQSMCISPKEVLEAMDAGVAMFGSSSMGALRAAECEPFGMVGVGKIFDEYVTGRIDADDEVAVVYDEKSGTALSEPMVNLRFAVAAGLEAEAFSPATGDRFLDIAKGLYFPQRNARTVLMLLRRELDAAEYDRVAGYFTESAPDTKRDDALLLLARMRERLGSSSAPTA